jgi:large subunit ribosomal protein L22
MSKASTIVNKSPRKVRLIIDHIRGLDLYNAMSTLKSINKEKTKHIFNLLKSAAANMSISDAELSNYVIKDIVAEEAQRLYRVVPRARGSAFRIRRRYSRIKVEINKK